MSKNKRNLQRVQLSARVQEEDRRILEKLAVATGKTLSQITSEIIHSALSEDSGLNEKLERIESKMTVILDKLESLSKDCIQLYSGLERSDSFGLNSEAREKPKKVKRKKK